MSNISKVHEIRYYLSMDNLALQNHVRYISLSNFCCLLHKYPKVLYRLGRKQKKKCIVFPINLYNSTACFSNFFAEKYVILVLLPKFIGKLSQDTLKFSKSWMM